jgi:thioredoxin-dependent peroxiredoxin
MSPAMPELRKAAVLWKGTPTDVLGPALKAGDTAPSDFVVTATDMKTVAGSQLAGTPRIVCAVPSLDTAVCDLEMKRFNQEAAKLSGVKVYVVSLDLPFAQKRWCGATGSDRLEALSDFKERSFGSAYGVLAPAKGLFVRAVFVIGKDDKLRHVEYVKDVASEPDYAAALTAAQSAV